MAFLLHCIKAAIFHCDKAALVSPSIFPMSTSERCFPGFRVGGMFSIRVQSLVEGGYVKIGGGLF